MTPCPRCEAKGHTVAPATLGAQVLTERLEQLTERDGWRLCPSASCDVVYFRDGDMVVLGQTRGVPFSKSDDPDRLVCFCFEHSVAQVESDAIACGGSTIPASIAAACKAGRDDCERRNPKGRCCLGDVRWVAKQATSARDAREMVRADGACCEAGPARDDIPRSETAKPK